MIVDLADLEFNDCTALHELAPAQQTARADRGDLLLAAPRPVRRHGCCS